MSMLDMIGCNVEMLYIAIDIWPVSVFDHDAFFTRRTEPNHFIKDCLDIMCAAK